MSKMVLEHLNNISNKKIKIPVVSLNGLFDCSDLIKEVEENSDIGKAFVVEFTEVITNLNKVYKYGRNTGIL